MYAEAEAAGKAKRQRKADAAAASAAASAAGRDEARRELEAGDMAGDGDKREAGRQIMKNRGLTRERKKVPPGRL